MKLNDIKYLALEGGGGRGIVYSGAFKFLSDKRIAEFACPKDKKHFLPVDENSPILGVAGSSAGAIASFMLVLGLTADEIDKETTQTKFDEFVEAPLPGIYKSVIYDNKKKRNIPVLMVDDIQLKIGEFYNYHPLWGDEIYTQELETIAKVKTGKKQNAHFIAPEHIETLWADNQKINERPAEVTKLLTQARRVYKTYKKSSSIEFVRWAIALFVKKIRVGRIRNNNKSNALIQKLAKNKKQFIEYIFSFICDRGLSIGVKMRTYFVGLLAKFLQKQKNKNIDISKYDPNVLTFKELFALTHKELKVTGTNITQHLSLVFSHIDTPDFPVVDAICMSASFPGVFKPTWLSGLVDIPLDGEPKELTKQKNAKNKKYQGFYVDGGMLNNIPIHLFDRVVKFSKDLNSKSADAITIDGVLGIGLAENNDPSIPKELYATDKNLKIVQKQNDKPSKEKLIGSLTEPIYEFTPTVPLLVNLLDYVQNMLLTWMYPMEDGQFRSLDEKNNHYLELYCYGLSTLNFSAEPEFAAFLKKQAFKRVYTWFGLAQDSAWKTLCNNSSDEDILKKMLTDAKLE